MVGEGQAVAEQINDHLPSALSGDTEGVVDGFALGGEFKAAKADGKVGPLLSKSLPSLCMPTRARYCRVNTFSCGGRVWT